MISRLLHLLAKTGHGAQNFFACLCGNDRVEHGFCPVRTMVIDRNCSEAELAVGLSATQVVATIYSCHLTRQQKWSGYSSIHRARPRCYRADMDISRVDLRSVWQRADDKALAVVRVWCPGAAYPDPKESFEPFGEGLSHVNPDHVWMTSGDILGGETQYDVDTRGEVIWDA